MDTRPFSPDVILTSIPALLPYLEVTLMVGLISVVTGSAFGLLLAWARLSGNRILSSLAEGYTYIIRCTPSIVLLFIVAFTRRGRGQCEDKRQEYHGGGHYNQGFHFASPSWISCSPS